MSRQGYYASVSARGEERRRSEEELREQVRAIHDESRGTYGSPRVHAQLRASGVHVAKRRVERALRSMGLTARKRRHVRVTTRANARHPVAPNVLQRDFRATRPNERWVTDISYVWTNEGWCYLAVILDLYSRAVVGWALDTHLTTRLPLAALDAALRRRRPDGGLLHHSDRGCQYTSTDYQAALRRLGVVVSMSRKGNCWDNAVAESFFATIKEELVYRRNWQGRNQLRSAVFEYIEVFYNRRRLHSALGYRAPIQFEQEKAIVNAA